MQRISLLLWLIWLAISLAACGGGEPAQRQAEAPTAGEGETPNAAAGTGPATKEARPATPTLTPLQASRDRLVGDAGGLRIALGSVDANPGERTESWSFDEMKWEVAYTHPEISVVISVENVADAQRSLSSYEFLLAKEDSGTTQDTRNALMLTPSGKPLAGVKFQDEVLFPGEVRSYQLEFQLNQ